MSHLRNFILIITIVVSGCKNPKEVKIDNEDPTYFSSNIDLLSIQKKQNIELYTLNDTIKAKVQKNKNSYILKCVKKKRLFRKKNLILYPLVNNNFLKLADSIINLNNQLKENKLISVFTKKIKINNQFFLVQEDIDKILIESNDRREGKIFKVIFKNSNILVSSEKKILEDSIFINAIKNLISHNVLNHDLINKGLMEKFDRVVDDCIELNPIPNNFYLNPITYKLEPILTGINNFLYKESIKYNYEEIEENKNYLNFFKKVENNSDLLVLKNSNTVIDKSIIIPRGFQINIYSGQTIDLINQSFILSMSPISFLGSERYKIIVSSSDSSGQGIHIIQIEENSTLNYLVFENQHSLLKNQFASDWKLPSAFTIYDGKVEINNCRFSNLKNEDAINIFRSNYLISSSKIENTFSDAFDADFSEGTINNCTFLNCGNDAVDISGGELIIDNSIINMVKDKAISAGEESIIQVNNCKIENSSLGIISKDLSKVNSSNSSISNCEVAYCAFQKKKEYGPGKIFITNNNILKCEKDYIIEYKSVLKIDSNYISKFQYNVGDLLYGNSYGKATFK